MSNKTKDFLTDMTEESTENSNTQIYQEGFYCFLHKSIKNKQ